MSLRFHERRRRLDGLGRGRRQVERRAAQLDLALRDPRQVGQVVHQPHHLLDLPLDDVARLRDAGVHRAE